ncbi:hypothetical protein PR048_016178 [Dryococelus australis]|uniref:Uncharacterized protein n=1 Tax=Dryococelus australis TaxID=614101 RepID=A0ABQ9HJ05_9NEOP|nr:hypothetical protein PR048_016178 [Dryococelus australis]
MALSQAAVSQVEAFGKLNFFSDTSMSTGTAGHRQASTHAAKRAANFRCLIRKPVKYPHQSPVPTGGELFRRSFSRGHSAYTAVAWVYFSSAGRLRFLHFLVPASSARSRHLWCTRWLAKKTISLRHRLTSGCEQEAKSSKEQRKSTRNTIFQQNKVTLQTDIVSSQIEAKLLLRARHVGSCVTYIPLSCTYRILMTSVLEHRLSHSFNDHTKYVNTSESHEVTDVTMVLFKKLLPVTTRDYLRLPVTTCDYLRLFVTACDYLRKTYGNLRLHATTCDYLRIHEKKIPTQPASFTGQTKEKQSSRAYRSRKVDSRCVPLIRRAALVGRSMSLIRNAFASRVAVGARRILFQDLPSFRFPLAEKSPSLLLCKQVGISPGKMPYLLRHAYYYRLCSMAISQPGGINALIWIQKNEYNCLPNNFVQNLEHLRASNIFTRKPRKGHVCNIFGHGSSVRVNGADARKVSPLNVFSHEPGEKNFPGRVMQAPTIFVYRLKSVRIEEKLDVVKNAWLPEHINFNAKGFIDFSLPSGARCLGLPLCSCIRAKQPPPGITAVAYNVQTLLDALFKTGMHACTLRILPQRVKLTSNVSTTISQKKKRHKVTVKLTLRAPCKPQYEWALTIAFHHPRVLEEKVGGIGERGACTAQTLTSSAARLIGSHGQPESLSPLHIVRDIARFEEPCGFKDCFLAPLRALMYLAGKEDYFLRLANTEVIIFSRINGDTMHRKVNVSRAKQVHVAQRKHSTPVQRRSEGASTARVNVIFIAPALPCLKRTKHVEVDGAIKADTRVEGKRRETAYRDLARRKGNELGRTFPSVLTSQQRKLRFEQMCRRGRVACHSPFYAQFSRGNPPQKKKRHRTLLVFPRVGLLPVRVLVAALFSFPESGGVNKEVCAALSIEILRADESRCMEQRGNERAAKREIPEKICRPVASKMETNENTLIFWKAGDGILSYGHESDDVTAPIDRCALCSLTTFIVCTFSYGTEETPGSLPEVEDDKNAVFSVRNCFPKSRTVQPRVTSERENRYSAICVRCCRRSIAQHLASDLTAPIGNTVSKQTMYSLFREKIFSCRRPTRHQHVHWTVEQWDNILLFGLQSDSRWIRIWREPGTRFQPSNIVERDQDGDELMVYRDEILALHIRLFRGAVDPDILLMDGNTRPHRAQLKTEDIMRMEWFTRFPNLNQTEHVQDTLGRQVASRSNPPITLQGLRSALHEEGL